MPKPAAEPAVEGARRYIGAAAPSPPAPAVPAVPAVSTRPTGGGNFVSWKPKQAAANEGLIFVAIAAYRDAELVPTVQSMLDQARFPDKLRFGICLQESQQGLNEFPWYGDARFRVIRVPAERSRGCCWARAQMQTLYQSEAYYCQIDSHERFAQHWDERAIWQLHHCRSSRPILSTYLPPYCPETEQRDVQLNDLYSIAITGYDKRGLITFRPQLILADELPLAEPRPAFMIAGGFIFTLAEWMLEVPYDPRLYFNGEEVSLAVRSWTHGWDIFCPNQVVAFHYYQRKDEPKHWKDHEDWRTVNKSSTDLVLQQLKAGGGGGGGRYGLGSLRTLEQYQAFAGVSFEGKTVAAAAKRGLVSRHVSNGYRAPEPPACYAELVAQPMRFAPPPPSDAARPLVDTGLKQAPKALLPQALEPRAQRAPAPGPATSALPARSRPTSSWAPSGGGSSMGSGFGASRVGAATAPKTKSLISTNPSRQPLVKNLFPMPSPRSYRRIDYGGGAYLAKDSTGAWYEYKNGQRFATFQQRRGLPNDDHILLYDASRELNLRIDGKGHCEFVQGPLRPDSTWRTNFNGEWQ